MLKPTPTHEAVRLTVLAQGGANLSAGLPVCMWAFRQRLVTKPPLACRTHTSGPQAITAITATVHATPATAAPQGSADAVSKSPRQVVSVLTMWVRPHCTSLPGHTPENLPPADMRTLRHAALVHTSTNWCYLEAFTGQQISCTEVFIVCALPFCPVHGQPGPKDSHHNLLI